MSSVSVNNWDSIIKGSQIMHGIVAEDFSAKSLLITNGTFE